MSVFGIYAETEMALRMGRIRHHAPLEPLKAAAPPVLNSLRRQAHI
jgi:hypothetical protein